MPHPLPADHPDRRLVDRLRAGDEQAFRDLYLEHHRSLVRLGRVFVPDEAIAEEVVQETWVVVLRKLPGFEGRSRLRTWIYRILTNQAKKRGEKERRVVPFTAMAGQDESPEALDPGLFLPDGHWRSTPRRWQHDTPERLAESNETCDFVMAEVDKLPDKERAVVRLRDLEEWSAEEVCEVLEISAVYQRVLLHRGRTKLRGALDEYLTRGATGC